MDQPPLECSPQALASPVEPQRCLLPDCFNHPSAQLRHPWEEQEKEKGKAEEQE